MIILLGDFPDNVIAARAEGQVTGEDYTQTLVPAVEAKIAVHDRVRLLYQIGPDFKRFTTTALWEDAKIGLHHLGGFERIAVVTDVAWIRKLVDGIGGTIPGATRCFTLDEIETAKAWIQEA